MNEDRDHGPVERIAFHVGQAIRRVACGYLPILALAALCGCAAGQRKPEDREQIVGAVLALIGANGRAVCVDDQTQGDALRVFKEMSVAPRPARDDLRWYPPTPLRPDMRVTTRELRGAELGRERLVIREPGARDDALPGLAQLRFDGAATRLGRQVGKVEESVAIRQSWIPRGVQARWWPLNRVRRDCWPLFELSDPVRDRQTAFVTVRAEHWGTLYALERSGGTWRVIAEWSRWLY